MAAHAGPRLNPTPATGRAWQGTGSERKRLLSPQSQPRGQSSVPLSPARRQ